MTHVPTGHRPAIVLLAPLALAALMLAGCGSSTTPPASPAAATSTSGAAAPAGGATTSSTGAGTGGDACRLFPPDEAAQLLGQPVANTRKETLGMFASCYYSGKADTAGLHFVELQVATTPFTKDTFATVVHNEGSAGGVTPKPVAGLGDAAYEISPGYLQVLAGSTFFQVNMGGTADDEAAARRLATATIARLK